MVFTKLLLEKTLAIRPCNCKAVSEPLLPKVARCNTSSPIALYRKVCRPCFKALWVKPDFHSRFSLVPSEMFRIGHAQNVETNRTGRKISFALFAFEVQTLQFCEIFLQRNQSDFFLESPGHFTRIEKISQNGRPTALTGLREDRPQYLLKTRIIERHTFRLRQFFAGILRKWRLIFLPRYFSLTKNSVSDRRKAWMEIRL